MFTSDMIKLALEEDIGQADVTTLSTVDASLRGVGKLKAKENLVLCGTGVFGAVFTYLDPSVSIKQLAKDGDELCPGDVAMEVSASFSSLLQGERVALNFVQRLSGISTHTKKFVEKTGATKTRILDTRKTTPLYRHLEKYAVKTGGGTNHRFGLYDELLIKDNHIAACHGSVASAIEKAKTAYPHKKLVVEVVTCEQVESLLSFPVDRFLLDNMEDEDIERCVKMTRGRAVVEVSGGVTLDRVEKLSSLGVDYISVGALTHSSRAVDLNFKVALA